MNTMIRVKMDHPIATAVIALGEKSRAASKVPMMNAWKMSIGMGPQRIDAMMEDRSSFLTIQLR